MPPAPREQETYSQTTSFIFLVVTFHPSAELTQYSLNSQSLRRGMKRRHLSLIQCLFLNRFLCICLDRGDDDLDGGELAVDAKAEEHEEEGE